MERFRHRNFAQHQRRWHCDGYVNDSETNDDDDLHAHGKQRLSVNDENGNSDG